jgi:hypothetical protein
MHDEVFVTNESSHHVTVCGLDGVWLRTWGQMGLKRGEFRCRRTLALGDGEVYAPQLGNAGCLQVFRMDGTFLRAWSAHVLSSGSVLTFQNGYVLTFDAKGKQIDWQPIAKIPDMTRPLGLNETGGCSWFHPDRLMPRNMQRQQRLLPQGASREAIKAPAQASKVRKAFFRGSRAFLSQVNYRQS